MKSNKQTENILIGSIIILIISLLTFFGFKKIKENKTDQTQPGTPESEPITTPSTTVTTNDDFPLKKGSRGENVKYLQRAINKIIKNSGKNQSLLLPETDFFGDKTYTALVTGVGTTTWWDAKPLPVYPVTLDVFNSLIKRSNDNLRLMNGNIYQISTINTVQ